MNSIGQQAEVICALLALLSGAAVLLALPVAIHGWEPSLWGALLYDLVFLLPLLGIAVGGWSHARFGYGLSLLAISWVALLVVVGLWRISLLIPSLLLGVTAVLVATIRYSRKQVGG